MERSSRSAPSRPARPRPSGTSWSRHAATRRISINGKRRWMQALSYARRWPGVPPPHDVESAVWRLRAGGADQHGVGFIERGKQLLQIGDLGQVVIDDVGIARVL